MGFPSSGVTFAGLSSGLDTEAIIARIMSLERRPIQRLQIEQAQLRHKLGAVEQYKSLVQALRSAAAALNSPAAFNAISALSSKPEVATVSAGELALPGTYNLAVSRLAQAQKVATAAQTDSTTALGFAGKFLLNGKAIDVAEGDSLAAIASRINSANAGVTASIINGGEGNVFLTFTAKNSGASNAIVMSDVGAGTVLSDLGVLAGAASIRNPITNGAAGMRFADSVTAVGTLLGISVPSGDIEINGFSINIDFANDSLSDIAAAINASGSGATASVVTETHNGATYHKLHITGATTPTFTDANGMLENLGILQKGAGNQLLAPQSAAYTLDGIALTSESNTITGVIPGATFTLNRADETTPETTTFTLSRNNEAIRTKVEDLVKAYNGVIDFLKQAAAFDSDSLASGPLFGNSTVALVQDMVFGGLLQSVQGLEGPYGNLLAIGLDFDSSGKVLLNASAFDAAIASNLNNVVGLFTQTGSIDDPEVHFVSATAATRASGLAGYEVFIMQLATQAAFTAGIAQTAPSAEEETLTFNGNLLNSAPYALTVPVGSTVDDLILQINTDPKLKDLVTASKGGSGELEITSKKYGTPGNFSVVSSLAAGPDNSGIGDTEVEVIGLNVEGTINGEAATGSGQFLTGTVGNANTAGLQLRISGGDIGSRGNLTYTKGAAAVIEQGLDAALDFVNGFITADSKSIQDQIDGIDARITRINETLGRKEETLRRRFTMMEEAVARLQSQTAQLGSLLGSLQQQR